MIKLAWRGIHENFSRSLFYWITFVLTTMFILFFLMSLVLKQLE